MTGTTHPTWPMQPGGCSGQVPAINPGSSGCPDDGHYRFAQPLQLLANGQRQMANRFLKQPPTVHFAHFAPLL